MYFGDDEEDSSSSDSDSSSNTSSSTNDTSAVDLSDKEGVVDPGDLKQYDPPESSLHIEEPPSPDTTPPGLRGDDPRVDISGRTPDSTDLPQEDQDTGGGNDQSSSSDDGSN